MQYLFNIVYDDEKKRWGVVNDFGPFTEQEKPLVEELLTKLNKKGRTKLSRGDIVVFDPPIYVGMFKYEELTYHRYFSFYDENGCKVNLPPRWRTTAKWTIKEADYFG